MAKRSTFQHYDLKFDRKEKVETFSDFRGIDYSPAQLNIASNHGIDALNIVFRDNINQKRFGWEQIYKAEPYQYYVENASGGFDAVTNPVQINGVYKYVGEDNKYHILVHIGNVLFSATRMGKAFSFLDLKLTPIERKIMVGLNTYNCPVELGNVKSQGIVQNKRLYLLTGKKLFVVKVRDAKLVIREVEDDDDTYIPKTSTGITYADSPVKTRFALDDVNLMNSFRRNGLVSGTYIDDGVSLRTTRFWDYQLDTSIVPKNETDLNKIKITINSLREIKNNG